jgi:hypothetical protein
MWMPEWMGIAAGPTALLYQIGRARIPPERKVGIATGTAAFGRSAVRWAFIVPDSVPVTCASSFLRVARHPPRAGGGLPER